MRILLLGDTHLGFREVDFFPNFQRALEPARRGEVDVVVHGGDLFYRSRIPPSLVQRAFEPIARLGVPTLIVPGNHERSAIPYPLLALHRNVFIFDRPRTFVIGGAAFSGFPFAPHIRQRFGMLLAETRPAPAPIRILCMHQAVEGARVGTPEFMFTRGDDVIRGSDIPAGFAAVFSGHIHRGQRLGHYSAPIFYAGSIERTAYAERHETKGFLTLRVEPGPGGGRVESFTFNPLPTVSPSLRWPAPRSSHSTDPPSSCGA
jgi:DNA repair exonuclease SbcCD nuclease subunit